MSAKEKIRDIFKRISTVVYYLCLLTVVPSILFLMLKTILLNFMPPSQFYSPIFITTLIIIYLGAIVGEFIYSHRRKKGAPQKTGPKPSIKRIIIVGVSVLAIGVIVFIVLNTALSYFNDKTLASLLEQSRNDIVANTPSNNVSQDRRNSTVTELQNRLNDLRTEYSPKINYLTVLNIYPNQSELHDKTGISENASGAYIFDLLNRQHMIYLVAEQGVPWFRQDYETRTTSGPGHEALHAVMTELLGPAKREKIPLGFEEGLAQYESLQGSLNLIERSGRRDYLWSIKSQISHDQIGSILSINAYPKDQRDIDQMYLLSYEIVRYVAHDNGSKTLLDILDSVVEGKSFASAFQDVTGKSVEQESYEWERWFFGLQR